MGFINIYEVTMQFVSKLFNCLTKNNLKFRNLYRCFILLLISISTLRAQTLIQVIDLPNNNFFNYGYGLTYKEGLLWVSSSYSSGNLGARLYAVDTLGIIRDSVYFTSTHVNSSQGLTTDGNQFYFVQRYTARCRIIRIAKTGQILDSLNWPAASSIYLGGIAYDGNIWASVYYPNTDAALYKIDINTSQVIDTIPTNGIQPQGIAVKGDTIFYVMDGFDGDDEKIYAVNKITKQVLFSFHVPEVPGQRQNPRGLAWDGKYLYLLAEPVGASSGRKIFKYSIGGGTPLIYVPTKYFNFGNVLIGSSGQVTASIQNQGTDNLRIDSVRFFLSQNFSTNLTPPVTILPNQSLNFHLTFTPVNYGRDSATFYIYHNDISRPEQIIALAGTGLFSSGVINLPSNMDFGSRRVGSTFFKYLKIENLSSQPLQITSWSTLTQNFYLEPDVFPTTIPGNSHKNVRVWFKPLSSGMFSDTLKIINNSTNAPEAKVFLSGNSEIQELPLGQAIWSYTIPNHPISNTFRSVKGLRAINDMTGDGKPDLIVCTENYWTVALNGNSSGSNDTLWSFNTFISNSSAGSIGTTGDYSYQKALSIASDLNGDGYQDVVIGTGGGNESVYALNGKTGQLLWKFGTDHPDSFALGDITGVDASTDFNGDGVPDVLAAASASQTGGVAGRRSVYLFNGTNGQIIWQSFVGGFTHGITAISDINNDNIPDVVTTVGEPIYQFIALSGLNGYPIWNFSVASGTGGAKEVLVFPVPGQKPDVIAGAFWGPVYRLKGTTGTALWTYSTGGGAPTQMKILRDVTGDGVNEVVISILAGGAACVNGATGEQLWFKSTGNTMGIDVVPDLNGDGSDDVVFAVQSQGALIVNGSNGNDLALYSFGGSTQAREVALLPDIDNNGSYEIAVGSNLANVALVSGGLNAMVSSIQVNSPNGGEIWYIGQSKQITWTSNNITNVKIELSTNNGGEWTSIVASTPAQSGVYEWIVSGSPSNQCRIRISSVENPSVFDLSNDIFTIRSELCVSFDVNQQWNLVSVPVSKNNMAKTGLFPNAVSSAFGFDQSLGYISFDTLRNGVGYWLKFPASQQITICGLPVETKIVSVKQGWNIIGGFDTDIDVSSLTTIPPNILQSFFFGYQNGYFPTNSIQKGKGYWIKVSENGKIIFQQSMKNANSNLNSFDKFIENASELIIKDNSNQIGKLYLTGNKFNEFSQLPPLPPSEVFDVRFLSDRFMENLNQENYVRIQGADYPIRLKSTNPNLLIEFPDGSQHILDAEKELVIDDKNVTLFKLKILNIPDKTELYQNYPNPFNPFTKIRYSLKESGLVTIKIYDVLGREIATILNEEKESGNHELEFNATRYGLSSGIYFYEMRSGSYVGIKKFILTK